MLYCTSILGRIGRIIGHGFHTHFFLGSSSDLTET